MEFDESRVGWGVKHPLIEVGAKGEEAPRFRR